MSPSPSTNPPNSGPSDLLLQPLRLPCGQVLPNRLAKAAMTERLSGRAHGPQAFPAAKPEPC